jgi:hypothetical protein
MRNIVMQCLVDSCAICTRFAALWLGEAKVLDMCFRLAALGMGLGTPRIAVGAITM